MPKPGQLSHVMLEVADLSRSEAFFAQDLGLQHVGRDLWNEGRPNSAFLTAAGQYRPEQMERAIDVLTRHDIAFEGPVTHVPPSPIARSIYLKDPSSNFLELACPREASAS